MRLDELKKAWDEVTAQPISAEMTFAGDCLVLGAETRLAKVGAPVDEARLGALLAAAHGQPTPASSLRHVRRAVETWRDNEKPLALTHLALSGLAKLVHSKEDARRLFLAEVLIEAGVNPAIIVEALELKRESVALDKYNPDQPRVPAGDTDGGQWTRDGETGTSQRHLSIHSSGEQIQVAQVDLDQTCESYITANCKGTIAREFPGQYLTCSLREVLATAKEGNRAAQKACKLLFRIRFLK